MDDPQPSRTILSQGGGVNGLSTHNFYKSRDGGAITATNQGGIIQQWQEQPLFITESQQNNVFKKRKSKSPKK